MTLSILRKSMRYKKLCFLDLSYDSKQFYIEFDMLYINSIVSTLYRGVFATIGMGKKVCEEAGTRGHFIRYIK